MVLLVLAQHEDPLPDVEPFGDALQLVEPLHVLLGDLVYDSPGELAGVRDDGAYAPLPRLGVESELHAEVGQGRPHDELCAGAVAPEELGGQVRAVCEVVHVDQSQCFDILGVYPRIRIRARGYNGENKG